MVGSQRSEPVYVVDLFEFPTHLQQHGLDRFLDALLSVVASAAMEPAGAEVSSGVAFLLGLPAPRFCRLSHVDADPITDDFAYEWTALADILGQGRAGHDVVIDVVPVPKRPQRGAERGTSIPAG